MQNSSSPSNGVSALESGEVSQSELVGILQIESSIKLECIHPLLLSKVVEPLGLIPESRMLAAFGHQAVNGGNRNKMKWVLPSGDSDITIHENGALVLCKPNPDTENMSSVYGSMLINHGLCRWNVSVEGPCYHFHIGLRQMGSKFSSVSDTCEYMLYSSGSLWTHGKLHVENYCTSFEDDEHCEIQVRVDITLRTCAFTINNKDYGTAWSDLPEEVYPALEIGSEESPVMARIKLASDPNLW